MSEAERTRRKHLVADMNLCCFRYSNGYRCDKRARRIVSHEQLEGFGVHRGLLASGPCVGMCVFHFGALERGEMSAKRKHGLIPKIEREYRAHFYNLEGEIIERMLDDLPRLKTDAHYEAQMPSEPEPYCGENHEGWKVYSYGVAPEPVDQTSPEEARHEPLYAVWQMVRRVRQFHRRRDDPTFDEVWERMSEAEPDEPLEDQTAYSNGVASKVQGAEFDLDVALRYAPDRVLTLPLRSINHVRIGDWQYGILSQPDPASCSQNA